jgi:OOP family OmpA-OmpF porin
MKTHILVVVGLSCGSLAVNAQSVGNVITQSAGQGVQNGATIATAQTANNVTNKLINKLFSKKNKSNKADSAKAAGTGAAATTGASAGNVAGAGSAPAGLKTYSKFDFEPGEKILVVEDFGQDAIGDFPDKWNTNSTGEVMTIDGKDGKWLSVTKKGVYLPEFINNLPDNFTLQFDLVCSEKNTAYSGDFLLSLYAIPNPAKQFASLGFSTPRNGVELNFNPGGGSEHGLTRSLVFSDNTQIMSNEVEQRDWVTKQTDKRVVKISIWRQRQRLRVYMNEEKVWDIPRAFENGKNYNSVLFSLNGNTIEGDRYLFSNIRLAVGAPDTRNKLITEGKFSTTGILFDVNSANIKAESYGTLKDIADVLKDNATVNVKIVGHTDSDGDAALNLALSKKRAEAVKAALATEFGIDATRMQTDGMGATQPVAPNTTPAGKAQNRRVEFVKI